MKIKIYKFSRTELFFLFGVFFLTINLLTYQALELSQYKNVLRFVGILCLLMPLILNFHKVKFEYSLCLILAYSIIQIIYLRGNVDGNALNVVSIIILIFSAKTIKYDSLNKIFLVVAWLSIIIWLMLLITGRISIVPWDTTRFRAYAGESIPRIRYSLGFLYEINLGSWYLNSAFIVILLCGGVRKNKIFVVTILTFLIYCITDSRTTVLFYLFFLLVYFFEKKVKMNMFLHTSFLYAILLCFSSVPFMAGYILKTFPTFDRWLSGRLYLIAGVMDGMNYVNFLFGAYNIPKSCFYYLLLAQSGVFIYILFLIYIANKIRKYSNQGYCAEFSFLIACMFVGLSEGTIFSVEQIISLYFWSLLSTGEKKQLKLCN